MKQQTWEESEKRKEEKKYKEIREEKKQEKRRSRETLCFSNDLWLRRVEK